MRKLVPLSLACILLSSCSMLYYSAMEHLGKQKRDILVQRILAAKKDLKATQEQLKTTLEAFQEVTGFQGGHLESVYNKLNTEYERSEARDHQLKDRVDSVDNVAQAMFKEWQSEIKSMRNRSLRDQSAALLAAARKQHAQYMRQMRKTEQTIRPVLQAFHDQVIFLKHNLNARAISSLKSTSAQINAQASALIRDIDLSSQEADRYIQTLSRSEGN